MVAILGSVHRSIWDFMAQTHVKNRTQLSSQSMLCTVTEFASNDIVQFLDQYSKQVK